MKKNWQLLLGAVFLAFAAGLYLFGLVETRVAALCFAAFALGLIALWLLRRFEKEKLYRVLAGLMAAGVCVIFIAMATVSGSGENAWAEAEQADYAVVLGCRVNGQTPSRTLRERLDLTLELMERNPELVVIVSGGQGADEEIAEGNVMAAYLEAHGADMSRVIAETRAHNTRENLQNSMALVGRDDVSLVIVTSDFHVSRACWIAGTLDLETNGIGSRTTPIVVRWCDLLREVFAYCKAFVVAAFA